MLRQRTKQARRRIHFKQLVRQPWFAVLGGSVMMVTILSLTHSHEAIISFDEGFHGGAALFFIEFIKSAFGHAASAQNPTYLYHEFTNGVVLYPHLWTSVAAALGLIIGPSVAVFRLATSLFYIGTVMLTYWFVLRATGQNKPALVCASLIATLPMVVIYSHLMMLEVPLLLAVSIMVMLFYLYALDFLPRRFQTILLVGIVFILAPHAKLPALPIAWTINGVFAFLASILFWRQRFYRHFLKPELGIFLGLSVASLAAFIMFENHYFHTNMVDFFRAQSQGISNTHERNPILELLTVAYHHRSFYLRDFRPIPILSFIWFGSVFLYGVWQRNPLGLLLIVWTAITYIAFSAVNPQVPQYIMPIYMPLAIATGLILTKGVEHLYAPRHMVSVTLATTLILVVCQLFALPKSEGYGWRVKITGQESAARHIASHAKFGDRIVTWHDGSTFAVRLAALKLSPSITNATEQVCPQALRDSYEWALTLNEPPPPSALDMSVLSKAPWKEVAAYSQNGGAVYQNEKPDGLLVIEAEDFSLSQSVNDADASQKKALIVTSDASQPAFWGCFRILPYGKQTAAFRLKTISISPSIPDDQEVILVEYAHFPYNQIGKRSITAGELRRSNDYQAFSFPLTQNQINQRGEFRLFATKPVTINLDSVTVTPLH